MRVYATLRVHLCLLRAAFGGKGGGRQWRKGVRVGWFSARAPQSNKTLAVPERFAPFFKHRSISTNSTGAVETHLADADASPDQKRPFYTAASFVLIHVPLLRGLPVVFSPSTSKTQLSRSLRRS